MRDLLHCSPPDATSYDIDDQSRSFERRLSNTSPDSPTAPCSLTHSLRNRLLSCFHACLMQARGADTALPLPVSCISFFRVTGQNEHGSQELELAISPSATVSSNQSPWLSLLIDRHLAVAIISECAQVTSFILIARHLTGSVRGSIGRCRYHVSSRGSQHRSKEDGVVCSICTT